MTCLTRRGLLALLPAAICIAPVGMAAAWPRRGPFRLLMVTSRGCHHCRAWRDQIGPGFAASPAGRAAPLTEVDIDGPWPDGLALDRRPRLTPSFLLLEGATEIGRVEGYVGARHFHPVLTRMMLDAGVPGDLLS